MPVVVKAGLGIKILPLKTQRRRHFRYLFPPYIAIGAITHLPGGHPIVAGQRQQGTEVVKLIVEYLGIRAFAFQLHQWLEAARLIDKAAVLIIGATFIITKLITVFGNQVVGLPQEFGDQLALCPTHRLANSAAKFVVLKMAIATQQQPVTLGTRPLKLPTQRLAQQVARRIVQEPLGQFTTHLQQAVQRVVAVVLLPLHTVIDLQQIAGAVIAVAPFRSIPLSSPCW